MTPNKESIITIEVPAKVLKRPDAWSAVAATNYYETIEIFKNRVSAYQKEQLVRTWYFKDYNGIEVIKANINCQCAQIVFLTDANSKNHYFGSRNIFAMQDLNRLLFCSGMFSFAAANDFAAEVGSKIRSAFEEYKNQESYIGEGSAISAADELMKFKELLDMEVISQEEFDAKKKQLLGL